MNLITVLQLYISFAERLSAVEHPVVADPVVWHSAAQSETASHLYWSTVQKKVDNQFSILARIESRIETVFLIVMSQYSIPARRIKPE